MTHKLIHRGKNYTFDYVANKSLSIKDSSGKLVDSKDVLNAVMVHIRTLFLDLYMES